MMTPPDRQGDISHEEKHNHHVGRIRDPYSRDFRCRLHVGFWKFCIIDWRIQFSSRNVCIVRVGSGRVLGKVCRPLGYTPRGYADERDGTFWHTSGRNGNERHSKRHSTP